MRLFSDLWPFGDLPVGGFDLIMADPPWAYENWSAAGEHKNASAKYACQPLDWIKALPVLDLAAENALLWLWGTNPLLPEAIATLGSWGFTFKTAGTWVKTTSGGKLAFGTGYILRSANEPFLIGTRGSPKTARNVRSAIMGLAREHSRKPEEAYQAAEQLMPQARRLELFSRTDRPGWSVWGDEAGKFGGAA